MNLKCAIFLAALSMNCTWAQNTLSEGEKAQGWKLLWDGNSFAGWQGSSPLALNKSWVIQTGTLVAMSKDAHIYTTETYGDFELSIDWKASALSWGFVLLRVTNTTHKAGGMDAPAFWEALTIPFGDSLLWKGRPMPPLAKSGALFGVLPPTTYADRPLGEWNTLKVIAQGKKIEHWQNGVKILAYEIGDAGWNAAFAKSPLPEAKNLGAALKGHIMLSHDRSRITYRNVKIKPL